MSASDTDENSEQMRNEYDFSKGSRKERHLSYRAGHAVSIHQTGGTVERHYFTLQDGAVMIDPDLRLRFPDSEAVNEALRSIVSPR